VQIYTLGCPFLGKPKMQIYRLSLSFVDKGLDKLVDKSIEGGEALQFETGQQGGNLYSWDAQLSATFASVSRAHRI
jgi:hypothetical protein